MIDLPPSPAARQARAEAAFRQQQSDERRAERRSASQFEREHAESEARRHATLPRDLKALLRWFRREWQMQLPEDLHEGWSSVEWERPGTIVRGMDPLHPEEHACPSWPAECRCRPSDEKGEHIHDPGGGSRAGTPRIAGAFRAYLWGNPMARDQRDGDPINPLRYRLAQMATGSLEHRAAASFLFRLALHDFDVEAAGLSMVPPLPAPYVDPYATWCLQELDERMRSLFFTPISVPRSWRP